MRAEGSGGDREPVPEGLITDGERYNKVIDIWAQVTEKVAGGDDAADLPGRGHRARTRPASARRASSRRSTPIYIMADSGARGSAQQIRQLAGMRGLMAKPLGRDHRDADHRELPRRSLGAAVLHLHPRRPEGSGRHRAQDRQLRLPHPPPGGRRRRTRSSPSTTAAPWTASSSAPLVEGGEIIEPLGERILGRVALDDIHDPVTGEVLVRANEEIDESAGQRIENAGLDKVKIRSVLTCQTRRGICVECYGRDLARGRKGQHRRGGGRHRRPVDRRARHPAHHAHLPHRRCGHPARGAVRAREPATPAR